MMNRAAMGKQIARPPMKKKAKAKPPMRGKSKPPAMEMPTDMAMPDPRMRSLRPGGMKAGGSVKGKMR